MIHPVENHPAENQKTELRRRPLFALAVYIGAWLLVLFGAEVPRSLLWSLGAGATILVAVVWRLRGALPLRSYSSFIVASAIYAQCSWIPSQALDPPEIPARIEGTVIEYHATTNRSWYVIDGSIDAVGLPAMACSVIVQDGRPRPLTTGCRVVATGMVHRGRAEQQAWLQSRAASVLLRIDRSHRNGVVHGVWMLRPPPVWREWLRTPQHWIHQHLRSYHDPSTVALLMGMLLGDRSHLEAEDRAAVTVTGTAHILTVSGLHIGVITAVLLSLLGVQGAFKRWWQWVLVTLVIGGYVILTGASPPAVRAAIMASLAGIGVLRQHTVDGLNLLGASCLVQWWLWPWLTVTPSFIVSTTVTAALLLGVPYWMRALKGPAALRSAVAVSCSASAGSALPVAMLMQQTAPLGPMVNLIVVPLCSIALSISVILVFIGATFPWISLGILSIGGWLVEFLLASGMWVIRAGARISPDGSAPWLVGPAIVVACWWSARRLEGEPRRARWFRALLAILLVVVSVLATQPRPETSVGVVVRRLSGGNQLLLVQAIANIQHRVERRSFVVGRQYGRPVVRFVRLSDTTRP